MSGCRGGPTTCPTEPTGPATMMPVIVAIDCHWLHAEQIAEQVPSMNPPILAMCIFCESVWYLFIVAG